MFCFKRDENQTDNNQRVIYEIDGDKNLLETKISRQNEEDFFNFAN